MFRALLTAKLASVFSSMFRMTRRKKKVSLPLKIGIAILAIYVNASLLFAFGAQFFQIRQTLIAMKVDWLYFGLAGIMAFAFMFIGSVFTTQTQIYEAKDNALLLSMPIRPSMILASRMATLYVLNLVFETYVFLPVGILYYYFTPINAAGLFIYILCYLLLPLLALSLSSVFGYLLALISSRVRNKSLMVTVFSLLFMVAYFAVFSNYRNILKFAAYSAQISESIKGYLLPVYWFGNAVTQINFLHLVFFALTCLVPFAIAYFILSSTFIKVATTERGFTKIKYEEKEMTVRSAKKALFFKELKHFVASPMYMLNAGFGIVVILGAAILLIVKPNTVNDMLVQMPQIEPFVAPCLIAALSAIAATNFISAPSISIEGKTLWISQSLPVDGADILFSKVFLHIAVCLPTTVFAQIVIAVMFPMSVLYTILLFVLPIVVIMFCALFGIIINLHFPKFDWISETAAVKQSLSSLIAMFGGFGVILVPALLYGFLLAGKIEADLFLVYTNAVFLALCAFMVRYLRTKGKERFAAL